MEAPDITLDNPVVHSLACAAITPGLRSILAFDVTLETFEWLAQTLTNMLEITTGRQVIRYPLSAATTEADLWGKPTLLHETDTTDFVWQPGMLAGKHPEQDSMFRLITIPDLTSLNLITMRACVMLIGSDVLHLERHGRNEKSHPHILWLARCKSSEVGQLSPHLLDRFALRLSNIAKPSIPQDRLSVIQEWANTPRQPDNIEIQLSRDLEVQLAQALRSFSHFGDSALETVSSYFTDDLSPGCRREIALGRLAIARARLWGVETVVDEHVHRAAEMIGLRLPESQDAGQDREELEKPHSPPEAPKLRQPQDPKKAEGPIVSSPAPGEETPVYDSDTQATFSTTDLKVSSPYPEDTASVEREAYTLRLPFHHGIKTFNDRGPIIGVQPTEDLNDLAIVATLFEASKYQRIRRRQSEAEKCRIMISKGDLRSYRRAPIPEKMLVLLIDYTALKKSNWQKIVLPYLQWAYVERATLCFIKVGAADAIHELRAERVMARSVLNSCVTQALDALPGRATPLAHGFDLAFQTLRHALQHGRGTVREVLLIVITDGRGNIPLSNSQAGALTNQVNREGIDFTFRQINVFVEIDLKIRFVFC